MVVAGDPGDRPRCWTLIDIAGDHQDHPYGTGLSWIIVDGIVGEYKIRPYDYDYYDYDIDNR
jgi:hypothetical protein